MPIELKLNAPQAVQGSDEPIELPPLFDPTITVQKSVSRFAGVLGAQVTVAVIGYALGDPAFQAFISAHLKNQTAAALAVSALAAIGTGLRNWLKNRNKTTAQLQEK